MDCSCWRCSLKLTPHIVHCAKCLGTITTFPDAVTYSCGRWFSIMCGVYIDRKHSYSHYVVIGVVSGAPPSVNPSAATIGGVALPGSYVVCCHIVCRSVGCTVVSGPVTFPANLEFRQLQGNQPLNYPSMQSTQSSQSGKSHDNHLHKILY